MLHSSSLGLLYLITGSLYLHPSPAPLLPASGNLKSDFVSYEFVLLCFWFHIQVRSYLSFSDLFHLSLYFSGILDESSRASLVVQLVKNSPAIQETWVWSLGSEDPLEKGTTGYPLQYSGLENSTDSIVHGVAKSRTPLSDFHFHFKGQKPINRGWHPTLWEKATPSLAD